MINQISKADPILGITDRFTVKIDFDEIDFKTTKYWADLTLKKFKLGGYVMLKSSKKCYHVIFDSYVSWEENLSIIAWVSILSKNLSLLRYLAMQCIKMSSTLRVAPKGEKPSPRIVYRFGCQDHAIKDFLDFRQLIKRIHRHGKNKNKA